MPPTIRRARPDELDAVGRLTVDAYVGGGVIPADAPYLQFLGDAAHRDAHAELWVAVDERGVVGTVTFVEPAPPSARSRATVRPRSAASPSTPRRRERASARRSPGTPSTWPASVASSAMVLSSSTTMHAAHRLYERLGFTRLPERDWSPVSGVQLVAYALPL